MACQMFRNQSITRWKQCSEAVGLPNVRSSRSTVAQSVSLLVVHVKDASLFFFCLSEKQVAPRWGVPFETAAQCPKDCSKIT